MTKHSQEFESVVKRLAGYIYTLSVRFESNGFPYDRNDFTQEAKMAIWEAGNNIDHPSAKPDSFWKKVIRNRMLNFHKMLVNKVNRAQNSYHRDSGHPIQVEDFSDTIDLKVTLEQIHENT